MHEFAESRGGIHAHTTILNSSHTILTQVNSPTKRLGHSRRAGQSRANCRLLADPTSLCSLPGPSQRLIASMTTLATMVKKAWQWWGELKLHTCNCRLLLPQGFVHQDLDSLDNNDGAEFETMFSAFMFILPCSHMMYSIYTSSPPPTHYCREQVGASSRVCLPNNGLPGVLRRGIYLQSAAVKSALLHPALGLTAVLSFQSEK